MFYDDCTAVEEVATGEDRNSDNRDYMEDRYMWKDCFNGDENTALFALFDGHAGHELAEFLVTNIEPVLKKEIDEMKKPDYHKALKNAFKQLNTIDRETYWEVGATATVGVLAGPPGSKVLYMANCGDSEAHLFEPSGKAVMMTEDHNARNPNERRRL